MSRIAVLGLGAMGTPIARLIEKAGYELTVWSRHRKTLDGFETPPRWADSAADAVRDAELVITMLADDAAAEAVTEAVLPAMARDAVHISMSTLSIETAKKLAARHADHGSAYVAAPVLGRPDAVAAGRMWIICAGPEAARAAVRPLLQSIGRGLSEFGDEAWRANLVKLGNNFLLMAMLEAMGEATALMRKADIAPTDFLDVVNALFASPVYANYGAQIAEAQHEPAQFKLALGLKDSRLVLAAGEDLAAPMPLASLAHDGLLQAVAHGMGDQDWSALAAVAQSRAGLPTGRASGR